MLLVSIKSVGCECIDAMQPDTEIKEVVLCQASENVDSHPLLCALEDTVISSTESAIRNSNPLANWDEYNHGLNA